MLPEWFEEGESRRGSGVSGQHSELVVPGQWPRAVGCDRR